ncbi:hypothetical protein HYALB_00012891 [Hymenoscyphus albidus]|uniref:RBR-type E3 ubiquitin transferase n=1 Tax=Hymenoscyphus albidus TaxID=595503 RepID=A0A9N9LQ37_9HELO|nr:hypothetical protein HYALB_00012891 [Hymenoscyphus albidus]
MAANDGYETEVAAWNLQIADTEALLEALEDPDSRAAAQFYLEELQHTRTLLQDRHMGQSLAQAFDNDAELSSDNAETNEPATEHHEDQDMASLAALDIPAPVEMEDLNNLIPEKADNTCVICLDENLPSSQAALRPCGHAYCGPCIQEHFDKSLQDESIFPPACCDQEIIPEEVNSFLRRGTRRRFYEKKIEFLTPHNRRVCCSNVDCATFIPMDTHDLINNDATCQKCHTITCIMCKEATHWDVECTEDHALNRVLEIGREEGWKRCENCRTMIDLAQGCFHMICVCGHEFCYLCGARWKTCPCDQFDEAHLLDGPPPDNEIQIHPHAFCNPARRWGRVEGEHICEICFTTMLVFILECTTCGIRACHRCRYHMNPVQ